MHNCFHLRCWVGRIILGAAFIAMPAFANDESSVIDLMRKGQWNPALSITERHLAKHPGDASMRFLRGLLQQKSGRQRDAIMTYKRLIQDHPALPEPYHNLAVLYAAQGQFELCRSTLEQAAAASRSLANRHEKLGDVYAHMAMSTYRQALAPQDPGMAQTAGLPLIQQLIAQPAPRGYDVSDPARGSRAKGK